MLPKECRPLSVHTVTELLHQAFTGQREQRPVLGLLGHDYRLIGGCIHFSTPLSGLLRFATCWVRLWHCHALQVRYQKGVQHMLDCWFKGEPFPEDNYIVRDGELASQYS